MNNKEKEEEEKTSWLKAVAATYRLCRNASAGNPDAQRSLHSAAGLITAQLSGLIVASLREQDSLKSKLDDEGA